VSYTRYCLSVRMLQELVLIRDAKPSRSHQSRRTRAALERRELIEYGPCIGEIKITSSGAFALEQARQEGWSHEIP
jgi:hypothetical protein